MFGKLPPIMSRNIVAPIGDPLRQMTPPAVEAVVSSPAVEGQKAAPGSGEEVSARARAALDSHLAAVDGALGELREPRSSRGSDGRPTNRRKSGTKALNHKPPPEAALPSYDVEQASLLTVTVRREGGPKGTARVESESREPQLDIQHLLDSIDDVMLPGPLVCQRCIILSSIFPPGSLLRVLSRACCQQ